MNAGCVNKERLSLFVDYRAVFLAAFAAMQGFVTSDKTVVCYILKVKILSATLARPRRMLVITELTIRQLV
jgi:hypothetical protein